MRVKNKIVRVKYDLNKIGVKFSRFEIFLEYFIASIRVFTISNSCFSI